MDFVSENNYVLPQVTHTNWACRRTDMKQK